MFKVRKASLDDLQTLVDFTAQEEFEAEGINKDTSTLQNGIQAALENDSIARYWILVNHEETPIGSVSTLKEWSDWNAGFYWWIQSMYITPEHRGKGLMNELIDAVLEEMNLQGGLELRLYVHKDNQPAVRAYQKFGFKESDYQIMTYQK